MLRLALSVLFAYLLTLAALYVFQRNLLYFPSNSYVPHDKAGLAFEAKEVEATTQDQLALKGWFFPPRGDLPVIVFFHGNADTLVSSTRIVTPLLNAGYGILIPEYRGYSGNPGSPTEEGLYMDGEAFLLWLWSQNIPLQNTILMGHSLGTGVVTQLATHNEVKAVILLSPFLSVAKAAAERYWMFPVESLVTDVFDSQSRIGKVNAPLLIVTGLQDKTYSTKQAKDLYLLAPEPKKLIELENAGHADYLGDAFFAALVAWIEKDIL